MNAGVAQMFDDGPEWIDHFTDKHRIGQAVQNVGDPMGLQVIEDAVL